jgi:hypothetical protein
MRVLLLTFALALVPVAARGAHPTVTEEERVHRLLAVSGLAWDGRWGPDFPTVGLVYQLSLATTHVTRDDRGERIEAPSVFLHSSLLGGANLFSDPHAVGIGTLGLVARRQWPVVSAAGLLAAGELPQRQLGPALRVELFDVVGLQAGVLFHAGKPHAFVSVDALFGLLKDVGLLHGP